MCKQKDISGEYKICLILFILAVLLRMPSCILPPNGNWNPADELTLAKSSMLLGAGLGPTSLAWPSGALTFLLSLAYPAIFIIKNLSILWTGIISGDMLLLHDSFLKYLFGYHLVLP